MPSHQKIAGYICIFLFIGSLLVSFSAFYQQLMAYKRQVLCRNNLRQLATAFHLYDLQHTRPFLTSSPKKWRRLLSPYLYDDFAKQCPGAVLKHNTEYSYKINQACFGDNQRNPFRLCNNGILLFDAICNEHSTAQKQKPYRDIANRHLGGANLLMLDGSVSYCRAYKIGLATGNIGWNNEGGYTWKP